MILAVAEEDGEIAEHLGKAKTIRLFDIEDGKIVREESVPCLGEGHTYMLRLLKERNVGALVCGNLGKPAIEGLLEAKVDIYPALMGDVKEAAYEYLDGSLPKVPVEHLLSGHCCHHHPEEEGCGCCCHGGCEEEK